MLKKIKLIHTFLCLDGKVWVSFWSLSALIRFTLGYHIDPIFLGVLGLYTGHTITSKMVTHKEDDENE